MCYQWVYYAAQAAAAALAGYSAIKQGQATKAAEEINQRSADRNAKLAENEQVNVAEAAAIERRRLGERIRAERGMGKVNAAASGLDPEFGSPFDVGQDILKAGRADLAILGKNEMRERGRLDVQIADYHDGAVQSRMAGRGAAQAGYMSAGAGVLGAASNISNRWLQAHPNTTLAKAPVGGTTTKAPSIFDTQKLPVGAGGY